ncbi:MAG TPA: hypothetical protein VN317_10285 [Candidatus Methanoperedens sp.]|nr:hypothetical protein [Candidatus Methanoperedens sp.]
MSCVPAAVVAAYLLLRSRVLASTRWDDPLLAERFFTGIQVTAKYLALLALPTDIRVFYDVPLKFSLLHPAVLTALCGVTSLFLVIARLSRTAARQAAGFLLATVLALFPVSLVPAMILPAPMATRYLYIPSIFFSLAAGSAIALLQVRLPARLPERQDNRGAPRIAVVLLLLPLTFGTMTLFRTAYWENDRTFYARMVRDAPDHPYSHHAAGNYYGRQRDYAAMSRSYQTSLRLTKERQKYLALGYLERGNLRRARNELLKLKYGRGDRDIVELLARLAALDR